MPNTCFDTNNFAVASRDAAGKTARLDVDVHPGQLRIANFILESGTFRFADSGDLVRWCLGFGLHTLLGRLPHPHALMEAKLNISQDERFEAQKECLSISVHKYLIAGELEAVRRAVSLSHEEYSQIQCEYWRLRWLSTLKDPIEQLQKLGVQINIQKPKVVSNEK